VQSISLSSEPKHVSAVSACAKSKKVSLLGAMIAMRHRSISGTTPGLAMRGTRPARSRDDLPVPLAPITKSKRDVRILADMFAIAASRPKKQNYGKAQTRQAHRTATPSRGGPNLVL
jgi:hypothetical protein